MFEATNLSVGRGTPIAFQLVGAPWLRPSEVLAHLGPLSGVSLSDTMVTPNGPTDGKYESTTIPSIRLRVSDRSTYDPVRTAIEILAAVYAVHGDDVRIDEARFDRLAGTDAVRRVMVSGGEEKLEALLRDWDRALAAFKERREKFLLYQ
jgi:uncharacterized protein YbbC (DUF1343 family)